MADCDYTEEEGGGGGRKREGERGGRQKGRERREIILVITSTCYTHCLTSSSLNNIILLKYSYVQVYLCSTRAKYIY